MLFPSLEEYVKLSREHNIIPVYQEIMADLETPVSIFKKVGNGEGSYLLESVEGGEYLSRYSFIGLKPFLSFTAKGCEGIVIRDGVEERVAGNPLAILEDLLAGFSAPVLEDLPRFYGGAVGYFGYDLIRTWEKLPKNVEDDLELPDCHFVFATMVLIFDHVKRTLKIVCNSRIGQDMEQAYQQAIDSINCILVLLAQPAPSDTCRELAPCVGSSVPMNYEAGVTSNLTKEEFVDKVERAKEYIRAGDILQVVLSQRFQTPLESSPFEIYRSLRMVNPAPYLYFLHLGDTIIIGASPEMLVRVDGDRVETRPIAGTRPRGINSREDEAMAAELLADDKEKAEHLMLVDLARNDLGRICEYGSVRLTEFMAIERYSHVMHIVTRVEGKLREGQSQFDALQSCFPAGTVSGAPKIRAMEIIDELEPHQRGVYAGAIGYLSFTGHMDTCIAIRTMVIRNNQVYVQAGAGIVADSVPEREYQETVNKAMALLKTLYMSKRRET